MIKKIGMVLLIALGVIQFFRPEKNNSNDLTYDITTKYEVPEEVDQILRVSCNDCHSNSTTYPWYAEIQPVGWWLNDHVEDGKSHLNFSELTKRPVAIQNHKFEETVEMVEEKEMPLESYTYLGLHPDANLSDAQREVLIKWAKDQMAFLTENYPADSLVMPSRR